MEMLIIPRMIWEVENGRYVVVRSCAIGILGWRSSVWFFGRLDWGECHYLEVLFAWLLSLNDVWVYETFDVIVMPLLRRISKMRKFNHVALSNETSPNLCDWDMRIICPRWKIRLLLIFVLFIFAQTWTAKSHLGFWNGCVDLFRTKHWWQIYRWCHDLPPEYSREMKHSTRFRESLSSSSIILCKKLSVVSVFLLRLIWCSEKIQ